MRCSLRLCIAFSLLSYSQNFAQSIVSRASGFWDDPLTWENGIVPEAFSSDAIAILGGHHVVLRDARLADNLVVETGGSLSISSAGTLELRDGSGVDLTIDGRVDVDGVIDGGDASAISATANNLFFHKASRYIHRHAATEGSLPLASWHRESNIEIAGFTTVMLASGAGNWDQDFGSVIWNTTNLQGVFDLRGLLNHIGGSLIIQSTGTQRLLMSSLNAIDTLHITGDFLLDGAASVELTNSSTADFTIRVGGDVIINTSGTLSLANQGTGRVDVGNDLVINNGTITESGTATGEFLFNNARLHRFDRGASGQSGVFNGRINYTIGAMDSLDLNIAVLPTGVGTNNANVLTVQGTIIVGSTDASGAIQNNTTAGNVRTTVSQRVFAPGSRVVYAGLQPQFIGNSGLASGVNTETVIDNPTGVSLSTNVSVEGVLRLHSGLLRIGDTRALTLSNNVTRTTGAIEGSLTSALIITDSLAENRILDLSDDQLTLGVLSIDRRADNASVTFASDILTTQLNLVAGTLVNNNRVTLTENGMLSRWQRGALSGLEIAATGDQRYSVTYRTSSISVGPYAKIYSGIELPSATNRLSSLIIATGQSLDTVVLTKNITINNLLDMNRGRFYVQHHTIEFKGSVWSDDTGNFGQGTGTVIFSDSTSVQGSSNPVFNSIRILSGSYVRFARNISVSGEIDFESGSVVDASSITLTLNGSTPQTINTHGLVVGNMTVSKSNQSFVELQSEMLLRGILRFNSPSNNVDFRSNGFLTLLSATDTATTSFGNSMIYRLQNGNAVSGDVTVQRFMSGEGRIYRYLSSPVSNGTVAGWKDDFSITGNFSDPSPAENICGSMINRSSPSLYYYDEVRGVTTSSGYVAYPLPGTTSLASVLEVGRGYASFIRQCTNPTTVDLSGQINQQQISLPVSYTAGSAMSGWNLVGNPYPCTIDWDIAGAQGWIKTNIAASIAIRDNGGGGFYRYWDGDGEPADLIEGRIAPGQGFWVRAIAPNPMLAVREGVKVLQTTNYYRERDSTSTLMISLRHGTQIDKTYLKIRDGASNSLDSLDCPKLDNVAYDLATYSNDDVALAINAMKNISCSGEMKLLFKDLEAGDYQVAAMAKGKFVNYSFFLRDNHTGIETDLSEAYSFNLSTAIQSDDRRFTLRWQAPPPKVLSFDTVYTLCDDDSIAVNVVDPEVGVRYELWSDSLRFGETLTIHSRDMEAGVHRFRLRVITPCHDFFTGDTIVVLRSSPRLLTWRDGEICNHGSTLLAAKADDDSSVHWFASRDSDVVLKADTIFWTPILTESTSFYATAIDGHCKSKRVEIRADVISFEPVAITSDGNQLISSMQEGNEWYFNGERLAEERGDRIHAERSGTYAVKNRIGSCITAASIEFTVNDGQFIKVYPNPVESHLAIASDLNKFIEVRLLNSLGQQVAEIEVRAVGKEKIGIFDVTKLKAGLYFLRLVTVGRKEEILMVVKK
jgi:hypothetical protein